MKRNAFFLFCAAVLLTACTSRTNQQDSSCTADARCGIVYEMNIRQYTPEGTFAAAEEQLPRLKELGVDIVWLMPIHPIGVEGRKGSLGSYYAPLNYKEVNPEFGTLDDFDRFLATAHSLGLRVILDWVANHTSPDSKWIDEHLSEWYLLDSVGKPVVQYDWTDIAPLDWQNAPKAMKKAMEDAMRFWLLRGVDGFRCDVAHQIPVSFWKPAFDRFRKQFPDTYYLAEGERPDLQEAFDATYAWELHHLMNDIAQGKKAAKELAAYLERDEAAYQSITHPRKSISERAGSLRLMFTSNHDENSWSGTEMERMGDYARAMAVLTFTLPHSQPLIYTGQEVGFDHRFLFFEKDTVPDWSFNGYTRFYQSMALLRHTHPSLQPNAPCEVLETNDSCLAFRRYCDDDTVAVFVNLSRSTAEWRGDTIQAAGWKICE